MEINTEIDEVLNRFLGVEDAGDLSDWEIGRIKLWPIVRTELLFRLLDSKGHVRKQEVPLTVSKYVSLLRTLLLDSPRQLFQVRQSPIAALSSASMRRLVVEGKYFDVIYDFYRRVIPNMIILEDPWSASHVLPRFSPAVVDLDWIKVCGTLLGPINLVYKRRIRDFMNYVCNLLSESGLAVNRLAKNAMEVFIARSLIEAFLLRRLLVQIRPKLLFQHCASYGGRRAIICKMCRELGITTVEAQHGVVNRYHPAYNYAPGYCNRFSEYLPDYFLTFGSYWSEELGRFPVKKVVIGNPYLIEQKKAFHEKGARGIYCGGRAERQHMVLIISQPTVTEVTVSLAVRLRELLPSKYSIVYKPHPAETLSIEQKDLLGRKAGIQVQTVELYTLLNDSMCVVGVYSTVLFEAVAFGKPVFVVNSPISRAYIPTRIGHFFESVEELAQNIVEGDPVGFGPVPEDLWASDWEKRLRQFMDTVLPSTEA